MSAIDLYNRPSPDHAAKVAHSVALLRRVGAQHKTLTQASSLGAEDMAVTHLIHLAGIDAGIFVLDTGVAGFWAMAALPWSMACDAPPMPVEIGP